MGRCHITREPNAPTTAPLASGDHFVDTSTGNTYLSTGTASVADWLLISQQDNIITATVSSSSSLDIDVVALANLCTMKYVICVSSAPEDKWRSFEMLAGKKTATSVEDSLYAAIGSIMNVDFDFTVDGTNAKLVVTNNETFDVDIKIHKNLLT